MNGPQNSILAGIAIILSFALLALFILPNHYVTPPVISNTQSYPNYPMNMDITSYIGKTDLEESFVPKGLGDKLISVMHKVSYNEEKQQYVYTYKISYLGKKSCFLSWAILDKIFNDLDIPETENKPPSNNFPHLIELYPNKIKEFTLLTKEPPALFEGAAWIYKRKTGEPPVWELIQLNSQPGPLPKH